MSIHYKLFGSVESVRPAKKTILLLGASINVKNSFISKLQVEGDQFLTSKKQKLTGDFGLNYSFIQYKDGTGDLLSTLEIYALPDDYLPEYKKAVEVQLKNINMENLAVIPIFDYSSDPHSWIRRLNNWLTHLDSIFCNYNANELQNRYKSTFKNFEDGIYDTPLGFHLIMCVMNTEKKPDWDQDLHDYLQLTLRIISLRHGGSLIFYPSFKKSRELLELISTVLHFEIGVPMVNLRPELVESSELLIPVGVDSWRKIKTLDDIDDLESIASSWRLNSPDNRLIQVYETTIPVSKDSNPRNNEDPVPPIQDISYQQFLLEEYEKKLTGKPCL